MDNYNFQIVDDNGTITYMSAKNRTEAIEKYCRETGCRPKYVKERCIVRPYYPSATATKKGE